MRELGRVIRQLFKLRVLAEFIGATYWSWDREDFPLISNELYVCFVEVALTAAMLGLLAGVGLTLAVTHAPH